MNKFLSVNKSARVIPERTMSTVKEEGDNSRSKVEMVKVAREKNWNDKLYTVREGNQRSTSYL